MAPYSEVAAQAPQRGLLPPFYPVGADSANSPNPPPPSPSPTRRPSTEQVSPAGSSTFKNSKTSRLALSIPQLCTNYGDIKRVPNTSFIKLH